MAHWIALGFLALVGGATAKKNQGGGCMSGYAWVCDQQVSSDGKLTSFALGTLKMNNDIGESPCQVASKLVSLCTPADAMFSTSTGIPPGEPNSTQTQCTCNTVTYSLASACAVCQGQSPMMWSSWAQGCSNTDNGIGSFPMTIPSAWLIPLWAYNPTMDPTTKSFDVLQAQGNATIISYSDALASFNIQTAIIVASGIAYGIVVVLSFNCAYDMVASKHQTKRIRATLVVYITVMAVLSTLAFLEVGTYFWTAFADNSAGDATSILFFKNYSAPTPLPFLILGADGFMIYRCQALYVNISRRSRAILLVVLSSLFLGLCGTAVLFFFLPGNSWFGIILPTSTAINIILSCLITLRVARLQRNHRRILGIPKGDPDGTPYARISELCLESSSLMILFGLTLTIMLARNTSGSDSLRAGGWILVPLMVFPHICVITPLLISYRVAHGNDLSSTVSDSSIQFRKRSTRAASIEYMGLSRYNSAFDHIQTEFMPEFASQSSLHLPGPYHAQDAESLTDMQQSRQSTLDIIPESPQSYLAQSVPASVSIPHSRASSMRRADSGDSSIQTRFSFPFTYPDLPMRMQPSRQSSLNTNNHPPDSPRSIRSIWKKKETGYRKLPEPPVSVIAHSELLASPSRSSTLLSLSQFPFVQDTPADSSNSDDAASPLKVGSAPPRVPAQPSPAVYNRSSDVSRRIRKLPEIPRIHMDNV